MHLLLFSLHHFVLNLLLFSFHKDAQKKIALLEFDLLLGDVRTELIGHTTDQEVLSFDFE